MFACFGMNSLFGGPNTYEEPATVSPEITIRNLRDHIEKQEKREKFLDHKLALLAKEAKAKLASGDKKGAISAMKKRKLYQAELQKIENVKMTLETQAMNLESAAFSATAFQAMSDGNKTMQKIRVDMGGVEQVDDVMMDMQEQMDLAEEVNQAVGQSVDPLMGMMDEDDLMKELEDMETDDLEQHFIKAESGKSSISMPKVPTSRLSKREEDDLKMLQAELAM